MFVLELQVLPVLRRSPEGSGAPMDFADVPTTSCIEIVGHVSVLLESNRFMDFFKYDMDNFLAAWFSFNKSDGSPTTSIGLSKVMGKSAFLAP